MRLYKREDFLKLPEMTIYSRVDKEGTELFFGLFCKTSDETWEHDWVEQDLIAEQGFPNGIKDGYDAYEYQLGLRDSFQDFETDLDCGGRDGLYEHEDVFVVWDQKDITKLRDYLNLALQKQFEKI